jgi:hypothetical protein
MELPVSEESSSVIPSEAGQTSMDVELQSEKRPLDKGKPVGTANVKAMRLKIENTQAGSYIHMAQSGLYNTNMIRQMVHPKRSVIRPVSG